jgi:hypothetical protein
MSRTKVPSLNDRVDRWVSLRARRTIDTTEFTPIATLRQDFADWHEAEYPDVAVPNDRAFSFALKSGFKIRMEKLRVRRDLADTIAVCVNLVLHPAIKAAA